MREKRKRGSTLITVLAVSLIFMALSGVILKSISSTMKLNTNQKEREDLRYAAESGLEIARSYIDEKGIINQEIINEINRRTYRTLVDIDNNNIVDGNIGNNNIFDNSMYAGVGGVYINNTVDGVNLGNINISSNRNIDIKDVKQEQNTNKTNNDMVNVEFNTLESREKIIMKPIYSPGNEDNFRLGHFGFIEDSILGGEEVKVEKIKIKMNSEGEKIKPEIDGENISGVENIIKYISSEKSSPILIIEISNLNFGKTMKIVIVNTELLELRLEGETCTFTNIAFLVKGELKVISGNDSGTESIHIAYSTIFEEQINITGTSEITIEHQLLMKKDENGITIEGSEGNINHVEEEFLNQILKVMIPTWASNSSPSGNKLTINNGTFTN